MRGAASDEQLHELINDYFGAGNDDDSISDSDNDDSDDDTCAINTDEGVLIPVVQDTAHDSDAESEHDDPLLCTDDVPLIMNEDSVGGAVCDTEEAEKERIGKFKCHCQHYQQQPCSGQLSLDFMLKRRMEMNELSEGTRYNYCLLC